MGIRAGIVLETTDGFLWELLASHDGHALSHVLEDKYDDLLNNFFEKPIHFDVLPDDFYKDGKISRHDFSVLYDTLKEAMDNNVVDYTYVKYLNGNGVMYRLNVPMMQTGPKINEEFKRLRELISDSEGFKIK